MDKLFLDHSQIFSCPSCGDAFDVLDNVFICLSCAKKYSFDGGILQAFHMDDERGHEDVTEIVKKFYEENPFPNYQDVDTKESLMHKADNGLFANLLNRQIPYHARVLEVGCGTGQLSNYLGMTAGRAIFGADLCLNSLMLGQNFKTNNQIANAGFVQMNLFKPVFRPETFHVVICNGVLHHTRDPFGGFKSIARLVKKGGMIIVGLYNKYGRIPNDMRGFIFEITGNKFLRLDPHIRKSGLTDLRKHTWFMDQYKHPHESKHTIGEVLRWFDLSGFNFVNGIPKLNPLESFSKDEKLFQVNDRGSLFDRFLVQAKMIFTPHNEGGFYIMIGQKR